MITEWIMTQWANIVIWFNGLFPPFDQQVQNAGLMAILAPVIVQAGNLGAWIPWALIGTLAAVVTAFYVATLILRIIKSLIPTISG